MRMETNKLISATGISGADATARRIPDEEIATGEIGGDVQTFADDVDPRPRRYSAFGSRRPLLFHS